MPENNPNSGNQDEIKSVQSTGYSAEYVKQLREEAASWRTKLRDTEQKVNTLEQTLNDTNLKNTVGKELEKRGIKADPTWVKLGEGDTPEKAVDKFLKDYPQFAVEQIQVKPDSQDTPPKRTRRPIGPVSNNSNVENTAAIELETIKKDPIARAKLRDLYRGLLAKNSGSEFYIK